MGSPEFELRAVAGKVAEIKAQLQLYQEILSSPKIADGCQIQTVVYISRLSISSQFNYLLRTVPPPITHAPAKDLDDSLITFITKIMDPIRAPQGEMLQDFIQQTLDTIFLPVRNGGCGFQSAVNVADAAYVGSWALVSYAVASLYPDIERFVTSGWPAFDSYVQSLTNVLPILKDQDLIKRLAPSAMFTESTPKVQSIISRARATVVADRLFRSQSTGPPTSGPSAGLNIPDKDASVRAQVMANRDKTASAWICANPLLPYCRMSDSSFKTCWKIRTLQPLFPSNLWCKCGREIDRLGYHFYVCPAKKISSKVRSDMHFALKTTVRETGNCYLRPLNIKADEEEPHVKHYFPPKPVDTSRRRTRDPPPNPDPDGAEVTFELNPMGPNRRADVAFKQPADEEGTILIDVTTISPLVKRCKQYRPSRLADIAVKDKTTDYNKHFTTLSTQTAALWFFAIETNGVFSREAKNLCSIIAKVSGFLPNLQIIYQKLSVAIQNAIATQIYKALQQYTSTVRNTIKSPVISLQ